MKNPDRKTAFLDKIAVSIPRLFAAIQDGNERSEYILGTRNIDDRQVRLVLMAEVVDPGGNPLATHSALSRSAPVEPTEKTEG